MTAADLITALYSLLDEPSSGNGRYSDTTALLDLNRAYQDATKLLRAAKRTATATATGTGSYVSLPADMWRLERVLWDGTPLILTTEAYLDYLTPSWRATAAGTPLYAYQVRPDRVHVYPTFALGGTSKTVTMAGFIEPVSGGTGDQWPFIVAGVSPTSPLLPESQHMALAYGAAIRAYEGPLLESERAASAIPFLRARWAETLGLPVEG